MKAIALVAALALAGCGPPDLPRSHWQELRDFAASIEGSDASPEVPPSSWPPNLRSLGVLRAKRYSHGVLLVLEESPKRHRGVFVGSNDQVPQSGSGIGFERLGARIYRFDEKQRVSAF